MGSMTASDAKRFVGLVEAHIARVGPILPDAGLVDLDVWDDDRKTHFPVTVHSTGEVYFAGLTFLGTLTADGRVVMNAAPMTFEKAHERFCQCIR